MSKTTHIGCACGQTRLELQGDPILVSECLCNSCRTAAGRLAALPRAKNILTSYGATALLSIARTASGSCQGQRKEFRLSADAGSRRVVATCCNTPIFLELKGAHWLSVYLHLWPGDTRPMAEVRTMAGDLPDASNLPDDIPNLRTHTVSFYMKLLGAWIGMGFRNPKIEVAGKIDA